MTWLKEHGVISCYADYLDLPIGVLEDARALMEAQVMKREIDAHRSRR